MAIGVPALHNMIVRSRTEGYCRELSTLIQRTRLEAIKKNRPGIVTLDPTTGVILGFVDYDRDSTFNPDSSVTDGRTDSLVTRIEKPRFIEFEDQAGNLGAASVDGLSTVGGNPAVVLRPDGSVDDQGAFRISDARNNHLEIRISPAATGRVELRMWMPSAPTTAEDGTKWLPGGNPDDPNYVPWEWK